MAAKIDMTEKCLQQPRATLFLEHLDQIRKSSTQEVLEQSELLKQLNHTSCSQCLIMSPSTVLCLHYNLIIIKHSQSLWWLTWECCHISAFMMHDVSVLHGDMLSRSQVLFCFSYKPVHTCECSGLWIPWRRELLQHTTCSTSYSVQHLLTGTRTHTHSHCSIHTAVWILSILGVYDGFTNSC